MNLVTVSAEFLVDDSQVERAEAVLNARPEIERPRVEREHGTSRLRVSFEITTRHIDLLDAMAKGLETLRAVASDAGLSTDCEGNWGVEVKVEQLIAVAGGQFTRGEHVLYRAAEAVPDAEQQPGGGVAS